MHEKHPSIGSSMNSKTARSVQTSQLPIMGLYRPPSMGCGLVTMRALKLDPQPTAGFDQRIAQV